MTDPVTNTPTPAVDEAAAAPTEEKKEQTVGEVIESAVPKEAEKPTVGLDKFLEEKKSRKAAEAALKELQDRFNSGESVKEVNADLDSIASEYNVDKGLLAKLAASIKAETAKEIDEKVSSKLKPIEEKEKREAFDKTFRTHLDSALERMPEFKAIVNADVIKALSLDPKNANKTFTQLIEEAYGSAIGGRRTIETTTPGGGKEPEGVDFKRAKTDTAYFKEIMSDPKRKAEYNANMFKNGFN
jgi:hypothetical protein